MKKTKRRVLNLEKKIISNLHEAKTIKGGATDPISDEPTECPLPTTMF